MKFTLTGTLATPTAKEITDYIFERLKELFQLAVRKFFETLLSRIPVRTGFLAGSFYPAAQFFGAGAFFRQPTTRVGRLGGPAYQTTFRRFTGKFEKKPFTQGPKAKKKKYGITISRTEKIKANKFTDRQNEYYYPNAGRSGRILKTYSTGIPFTKTIIEIEPDHVKFEIETLIRYYQINDLYSVGRGTPWNSMSVAKLALIEEVKKIKDKINLVDSIKTWTQIRLDDKTVYVTKGSKKG